MDHRFEGSQKPYLRYWQCRFISKITLYFELLFILFVLVWLFNLLNVWFFNNCARRSQHLPHSFFFFFFCFALAGWIPLWNIIAWEKNWFYFSDVIIVLLMHKEISIRLFLGNFYNLRMLRNLLYDLFIIRNYILIEQCCCFRLISLINYSIGSYATIDEIYSMDRPSNIYP